LLIESPKENSMAHASDMNTATPMPTESGARMQIEGLSIAMVYAVCFGWVHLGSGVELLSVRVLAIFFSGLIAIPLLTGLPFVLLRKLVMSGIKAQSSVAAFVPFAYFALYALHGLLVWVVTREAYTWYFEMSPFV
jgi:hypothetical protein